jgi:hypothetical protein
MDLSRGEALLLKMRGDLAMKAITIIDEANLESGY